MAEYFIVTQERLLEQENRYIDDKGEIVDLKGINNLLILLAKTTHKFWQEHVKKIYNPQNVLFVIEEYYNLMIMLNNGGKGLGELDDSGTKVFLEMSRIIVSIFRIFRAYNKHTVNAVIKGNGLLW